MTRFFWFWLLVASSVATSQEVLMRMVHDPATDTHVEVLALFTNPAPAGYLPVRVTVANNQGRAHVVDLRTRASNAYDGGGVKSEARFTIAAEPGKVVTKDLLVPTLPTMTDHTGHLNLLLRMGGTMGTDEHQYYQNGRARQPRVLLSQRLHRENASALDREAESLFGSMHRHGGGDALSSRFDPKQLPSEWGAYGAYDWMTVTDEEWTEIPAAQRNAILSWVRLGGNLDIRHRMDQFERGRLGLPEDAGFGSISGAPIQADLRMDAEDYVSTIANTNALPSRGRALSEDFEHHWPLLKRFGIKPYPFGLFMMALVGFVLMVGPVNLFVFAPAGRRHRLFITTPLISLGAGLLMLAIIIFQDGFGGIGYRVVLMEVRPDDGQHAAYLHQEQLARSGIMTRGSFRFELPVMAHPLPLAPSRWTRLTNRNPSDGGYHLQPQGGGVNASGDWFQSRSEQGQWITAVEPSRGRIEGTSDGGHLSSFPYRLDAVFMYEDGHWKVAEEVKPGVRFEFDEVPSGEAEKRLDMEAGGLFSTRMKGMLDRVKLREGHFVAITNKAPGLGSHPSIEWKDTRTVITGPVVR